MTTKTITAFVDHRSERNTTGTGIPLEKLTETTSLLISLAMSAKIFKKIAVTVTNKMESPYLLKKNTQIAEFSIVTLEQSKFIKPVDNAVPNVVLEVDPDPIF